MAEAQRVQSALFGEATRQQQIESQGELFMYKEKDNRFLEQLDRKQAQMTGQEQAAAQRSADAANIMGAGLQGAGNIIGAGISGMASNMYNKPIPTPISTGNVGKITSAADQKLSSELGD